MNDFGQIAYDEWMKTSEIRKNVILDEFIIMPNRIHGIIIIDSNQNIDNDHNGDDDCFYA